MNPARQRCSTTGVGGVGAVGVGAGAAAGVGVCLAAGADVVFGVGGESEVGRRRLYVWVAAHAVGPPPPVSDSARHPGGLSGAGAHAADGGRVGGGTDPRPAAACGGPLSSCWATRPTTRRSCRRRVGNEATGGLFRPTRNALPKDRRGTVPRGVPVCRGLNPLRNGSAITSRSETG